LSLVVDAERAASQRVFFGVAALIFAGCAEATIIRCGTMAAMGRMAMPGDWNMSMAWMPMPGQTWLSAALSFLGMWAVMMLAMMLPSLMPMLGSYRQALGRSREKHLNELTALVGLGYFFVWTTFGIAVFAVGSALATVLMRLPGLARAVPAAAGAVILVAGALQFTAWKARRLDCCRRALGCAATLPAAAGTAWRCGLHLGLDCTRCCAGLTAILLVCGVMDVRVMAVVTAATTAERLAPGGERVARLIGAAFVGSGLFLVARAAAL
jgi:predicted metal-binding membrane protein